MGNKKIWAMQIRSFFTPDYWHWWFGVEAYMEQWIRFGKFIQKKLVYLKIYQQEISLEKLHKITSSFQDLKRYSKIKNNFVKPSICPMMWFMGPWFYKYLLYTCYYFTLRKLWEKLRFCIQCVFSCFSLNMYSLKSSKWKLNIFPWSKQIYTSEGLTAKL